MPYPIHQGQNLVGGGCRGGLAIELEHGTTSSRHAMTAPCAPGASKSRMGSTNGTFVGDLMLERGKKHELKDVTWFALAVTTIVKIV